MGNKATDALLRLSMSIVDYQTSDPSVMCAKTSSPNQGVGCQPKDRQSILPGEERHAPRAAAIAIQQGVGRARLDRRHDEQQPLHAKAAGFEPRSASLHVLPPFS